MGKVLDFGFWILDFGFWIEIVGCISGRGLNIGGQPGAAMLNTSQLDHPAFYPTFKTLNPFRNLNPHFIKLLPPHS